MNPTKTDVVLDTSPTLSSAHAHLPAPRKQLKLQRKSCGSIITSLLVFPPQFAFTVAQVVFLTGAAQIAAETGKSVDSVRWVAFAENAAMGCVGIFSNRLHAFFGPQRCYLFGSAVICLALLGIFCSRTLVLMQAFQILSAVAMGLIVPVTGQIANFLVKAASIEQALSNILVVIFSSIFVADVSFAAGAEWHWLILASFIVCAIHCVFFAVFVPLPKGNKEAKIDVIGALLLGSAPAAFALGISLDSWITVVLVSYSVLATVAFFIYNKKSKTKIIALPVFNKNTITFLVSHFLMNCGFQADRLQFAVWQYVFEFSASKINYLIGICKGVSALFIIAYVMVIKRVSTKWIATSCSVIFLVIYSLLLALVGNCYQSWIFELLNQLSIIIFIQNHLAIQVYNLFGSPMAYAPTSSTFVGFNFRYSRAVGSSIRLAAQHFTKHITDFSQRQLMNIRTNYAISLAFFASSAFLSSKIGVLNSERGRKGFSERKLINYETYPEMRETDISLEEVEHW